MEQLSPSDRLALLRTSRALSLVAGVIALGCGALILFWPDRTITAVARVVGVFLIVGGLAQAIDALVTHRKGTYWGLLLARGALDLAIGVVAVAWPGITIWALVLLIGINLILAGVIALVTGFRVPKEFEERSRFMWRGGLSIVGGAVIIAWPDSTVWVVAVILAIYLILLGIVLLFTGYQLGKVERTDAAT